MAPKRQVQDRNDASWRQMESAHTPMHVGSLLRFATPEGAGPWYLKDLVEQGRAVQHPADVEVGLGLLSYFDLKKSRRGGR